MAINRGCSCPAVENHHGYGINGNAELWGWLTDIECPIHGTELVEEEEDGPKNKIEDQDHS